MERAETALRRHMDRIRAENMRRVESKAANAAPMERHLEQVLKKRGRAADDHASLSGVGDDATVSRVSIVKPFSKQYASLEAYEEAVFSELKAASSKKRGNKATM